MSWGPTPPTCRLAPLALGDLSLLTSYFLLLTYLLSPERFNRIEPCGAHCWIPSEEQTDKCGNADAQRDRPGLNRRRYRGEPRDGHGHSRAEERADHAAEDRQHDRLGQ